MVIFNELNNFIKAAGCNKVKLERFQSLFCFNIRFDLLFDITMWWSTAVVRSLMLPVMSAEPKAFKLWLKIYGCTKWRIWYRNCATSLDVAVSMPDVVNLYKKWVPGVLAGWGVGGSLAVRKVGNYTTIMCRLSRNMGASVSWNILSLQ
jgi:hypothetical protein